MLEATTTGSAVPEAAPLLRLTAGGPGTRLLRRLKLSPPRWHARRIAALLAAVTWLPLLVLAANEGLLATIEGSFLRDLATHVRLLVALPVLILVEGPIANSLGSAASQFVDAGLVAPEDRSRYAGLIRDSQRLRDSRIAEILALVVVGLMAYALLTTSMHHDARAWLKPDPFAARTPAGYWYGLVSLPIFHLVWLRWLYLIGVWARFLGRVSRLKLRLNYAHPDGAGGLGFLGECSVPLGALLFAASSVLASEGIRRAVFVGAGQETLWVSALVLLAIGLAVFIGPLLGFLPALRKLRHHGVLAYGALASRYAQCFEQKWLGDAGPREALLGTPDIQSLDGLASIHDRIRKLRALPLDRWNVVAMAIPGLIPLLVFSATIMPMGEVLNSLLRIFA